MKRKIKLIFLVLCSVVCAALGLAACAGGDKPDDGTTYKVTYSRGADDATGDIPAEQSYEEGEKITLLPADTFAREGYKFVCWNDGTKNYNAGATYTMPAKDVIFTANWEKDSEEPDEPGGPDEPGDEEDVPVLSELDSKFYTASNWEYMTNNDGAEQDGGDIVYSLADGSVKFHRANQAINYGDLTNATVSFMLKGTNDWSIWFNSSSPDNNNNSSYRLAYAYSGLRIALSSAPEQAAANIVDTSYAKGEWNRFDVVFSTTENADGQKVTAVKVYVNGERAALAAGDNTSPAINVEGNVLTHTQPAMFSTGTYIAVKVWEAENYVQIKPVAKAEEEDVPVIAAIGASITEGAGAGNFYTESYPAQLQNALGGSYNVVNFGKSGRTVRTDTGTDTDGTPVPWLQNRQWTGVQAIVPDIAIINMGTNDSKTTYNPAVDTEDGLKENKVKFAEAYNHLLDELLAVNPDMRIIICTVPYAYSGIYDINNDNIANIIAPVQREIAEERGMELVDLYEITQNKSLLFGDGVHPGTRGYAMFAEVLSKTVVEGVDALTPEFLADIDERYNDIEYEINDIAATIAEENGQILLKVSGNIVIEDKDNIRLVVETGKDGDDVGEVDVTLDTNGDFAVSLRIDNLNGTNWYNTHLYLNDDYYYLVMLDETDLTVGKSFTTETDKVTVQSWESGGEKVFSFKVEDYNGYKVTLSSSEIITSDGLKLKLSGTSNVEGVRLYVGVNPEGDKWREYTDITVGEDGAFTVEYDLAGIPVTGEWVNVRIYYPDNSYFVVPLAQTVSDGKPVSSGNVFYAASTQLAVVSWTDGGVGTLSFNVTAWDGSYSATVTEVRLENGKMLVSGTAAGTQTLKLALINNDEIYSVDVAVADGKFSAELDISLVTKQYEWYRLNISKDGDVWQRVPYYEGFDTDLQYMHGTRRYYFTTEYSNTDFALVFQGYKYGITNAEITETEGKATLIIEGVLADASVAAENIVLVLNKTSGTPVELKLNNLASEAGKFSFTCDISELESGAPYFLRLYNGEEKIDDINSRWAADILFEEVEIGEDVVYYFYRNSLTDYYTLGVVREDRSLPAPAVPVVAVSSVKFEEGNLIVTGTMENVEKLYVYLINTNVDGTEDNYVEAVPGEDGAFTATLSLDALLAFDVANNIPFNLRYKVDDLSASTVNVEQGSLDIAVTHQYNGYEFSLGINNKCVAVYYDKLPDPADPSVKVSSVEFEDGNLVVTGTVANIRTLEIYLNNTYVAGSESNFVSAQISEGAFTATLSLDTLIGYNKVNTPFNLRYKADGATGTSNIGQGSLDLSSTCSYNGYNFRLAVNSGSGCVAVYYEAAPVVSDPSVAVTGVEFEEGNLVVSGTVENVQKLSVALIDNDNVVSVDAVIDGGAFTAEIALDSLTSANGNWYFLNIAADDGEWEKVGWYEGFDKSADHNWGARRYYYAGSSDTVALVYEKYYLTLTSATIAEEEGKVNLTLKGATTNEQLIVSFEGNDGYALKQNVVVSGGQFTFVYDLAQLPSDKGWINVRIYIAEGDTDYYSLKIPEVTKADGTPVAEEMVFTGTDKQITVKSWADWKPFSMAVSDYVAPAPEEPVINATYAGFEGGCFVFSGTAENIETLTVYLYNNTEKVETYSAVADIAEDGAFTVRIGLAQLALPAGNWYRVRVSVDGGEITQLTDSDFAKSSQQYSYGDRTYKFEENLAISYKAHGYAYTVDVLEIKDVEGVATLVIEGTYSADVEASSIRLLLDKTSATKEQKFVENSSSEKGKFSFSADISALIASGVDTQYKEEGYFIRLYNGETKLADINSAWMSDLQFEEVTIGNSTYYFYRNNATNYYTIGIVRFENQAA